MTGTEMGMVGLLIGAYVFIVGVWWRSAEGIKDERLERQKAVEVERIERQIAMAEHDRQDEARRDKVLEKLDEVKKILGEKFDNWAQRVGERQGKVEQDVAVLKAKAEK